jgi:hypothetical protein
MARMEGISNRAAYQRLHKEGKIYPIPQQPESKRPPEPEPCDIERRHAVYSAMLSLLPLSQQHYGDLLERGLSPERMAQNQYRTVPVHERHKRELVSRLAASYDLSNVPGFYQKSGQWRLYAKAGLLIPIRDFHGRIQALQIRLDSAANRDYRWLSTRSFAGGTKSNSPIHITGNRASEHVWITEGGLKGDVASYLDGDALFLCVAGINNISGLESLLAFMNIKRVSIVFDMDKIANNRVRKGIEEIRTQAKRAVRTVNVEVCEWPWTGGTKGIDDFYLHELRRRAA